MEETFLVADIVHVIELAVAPVFLLAGIAGFLGVLSSRLGRIADRVRIIENLLYNESETERANKLCEESRLLWKRMRLINSAIRLCTSAALLICLVVGVIFVGYHTVIDLSPVISLLFIGAMLVLLCGLLSFLREVNLATKTMHSGIELIARQSNINLEE